MGELEEADKEERFLHPEGTGFGAEVDSLGLFLPSLGFALEGAGATAAGPAGVANENKWNEVTSFEWRQFSLPCRL